jgi:hypothetical protein
MAVVLAWLRNTFVSLVLVACSPQLVDAVSGVSCCDDPNQVGCAGSGGTHSNGVGGGGTTSAGGTGGSADMPATLVHRYTFDGDGIDVTDSVGTANGNVFGTTLDGTGSVTLDGSGEQYVELPSFMLSGLKSASFEAWVTWNGGKPWQRIFDFGEDTSGVWKARSVGRSYLFCTPNDGSGPDDAGYPKVTFGRPGQTKALEPTMLLANARFPVGELTHVAVVVDVNPPNRSISIFVNGGFQGAAPFAFTLDYIYNINSWLGRSNFVADAGFNGTFHDFRIYSGALDANRILDNFKSGP